SIVPSAEPLLAGPNRPAFGPIRIIDLFLPAKGLHHLDGRGHMLSGPANPVGIAGCPDHRLVKFSADATRPATACYGRLPVARKTGLLKKSKYIGLTPM